MMKAVFSIFAFVLCSSALADELNPEQAAFYSSFVSASKSNDLEAIRTLTHPKVRACIKESTEKYHSRLERSSVFQFAELTDKADVSLETQIEADIKAAKPIVFGTQKDIEWVVLPESRIFASQREEGKPPIFATIYIANSSEGWRRVYPCQVDRD